MTMTKRPFLLAGTVALMACQLSACGYGWPRASNQYPPSSATRSVAGGALRSPLAADEYIVQSGDSLASIARSKGLSLSDLAAWNNVDVHYGVVPGQLLRTSPPTYRNPVSAAAGSVAYPPSESGGMVGQALPSRTPLQKPVSIASAPGSIEAPPPLAPPPSPPSVSTGPKGVGYSVIAPSATPIIAPEVAAPVTASPPPPPSSPPPPPPAVVAPAPSPAPPITLPAVPQAIAASRPSAALAEAVSAQGWRWPVLGTVVKNYAPANGS